MIEELYSLDTQLERINDALHTDKLHELRWRRIVKVLLVAFVISVISSLLYFNAHYRIMITPR